MTFPDREPGLLYLTEGGQETEIMYRHGVDLPEFAMFPLLDDAQAMARLRDMYSRYLDAAARHGFAVLMGGLDYRASPGWAARVGYDADQLTGLQLRAIEFLRMTAAPYAADLPAVKIAGLVGPRGDAYAPDETITADEAQEYHDAQLRTLARAEVDLVEAMTFNNVPEAVGVARAGAEHGLPVSISFTLDSSGRLSSGPTVREAIEAVDGETGVQRPAFYGLNCSHPEEMAPALEPGDWFERVRCLRPNAVSADKGALCSLGHIEDGDPPALGRLMGDLARRYPHVDIWGGCCGTWAPHLDQIAANVLAARGA